MSRFAIRDSYLWPAKDEYCYQATIGQVDDLNLAIQFCKKKDVVIQAGGNCGIWPKELSSHFKWVYTFEPDADNFVCLVNNAPEYNIIRTQAVLGDKNIPVGMSIDHTNIGAHCVAGVGVIPQIRIDDLNLPACDFMQLDIEGYEFNALLGAENTIKKYNPVLMLENKGHEKRYGVADGAMQDWLEALGYKLKVKVGRDIILVKE